MPAALSHVSTSTFSTAQSDKKLKRKRMLPNPLETSSCRSSSLLSCLLLRAHSPPDLIASRSDRLPKSRPVGKSRMGGSSHSHNQIVSTTDGMQTVHSTRSSSHETCIESTSRAICSPNSHPHPCLRNCLNRVRTSQWLSSTVIAAPPRVA